MHMVHPGDIYNYDESPIELGQAKTLKVVIKKGSKNPCLGRTTNREHSIIREYISGDSQALPPFIILKGKCYQARQGSANIPGNYLIGVSESAFTNDVLSLKWIKHFKRFTRKRATGAKRLLLLNSYTTYCTTEFLKYANRNNIIIFLIMLYTIYLLQPLDVGVFGAEKNRYKKAINQAFITGYIQYKKLEFLDDIY